MPFLFYIIFKNNNCYIFINMVILGLDASTSTVGYAFNDNGKIVEAGFIDIKKYETNKEKSFHVIEILNSTNNIKNTEIIVLEAALSGFSGGKTSQQTVIKLARFNAVFEYILSEYYKINIKLDSVISMRKNVFGRSRITGIKSKDFVKMMLENKYPYVKDFLIKGKSGKLDIKNGDMYDAMVCALSFIDKPKK